jgi:hypothetical protein
MPLGVSLATLENPTQTIHDYDGQADAQDQISLVLAMGSNVEKKQHYMEGIVIRGNTYLVDCSFKAKK